MSCLQVMHPIFLHNCCTIYGPRTVCLDRLKVVLEFPYDKYSGHALHYSFCLDIFKSKCLRKLTVKANGCKNILKPALDLGNGPTMS